MKQAAGFSLVELVIAIAIMGVLLSLGLPAFSTYLGNAKLKATAHSFLAGMQLARSEAVRRNGNVEFVLTDNDYTVVGFATVAASTSGRNWVIRATSPATFIEAKFGAESSGAATVQDSPVQVAGGAASVTFTGLGTTTLGAATTFRFTNPAGGDCATAGGPIRCLNVVVSVGGQARLCDPAATAAGDTRGC